MDKKQVYSWYNQYKNGIYRYILSISHDPELAEDVLQDTFLKLLTEGIRFKPGNEQAWLYKVARNRCYDILKREKKRGQLSDPIPSTTAGNFSFFDLISPLTPKEQEIVALKFIGGFSHKEIAKITGITTAAAKKRYERAIQKLRAEMEVSKCLK